MPATRIGLRLLCALGLVGSLGWGMASPAHADEALAVVAAPVDGTSGNLDVSWSTPSSQVTGFQVSAVPAGAAEPAVVLDTTGTTARLTGLADSTSYDVTVAARTGDGASPTATATTTATTAPGQPVTDLQAGDGTATVTWTPPASDARVPVTAYEVRGAADGSVQTLPADARASTVTALANGVPTTISVTARTDALSGTAASSSVTPRKPGQLVVRTQPRPAASYGTPSVVGAAVRALDGSALAGSPVQLLARLPRASVWRLVATATTDASGNAALVAALPDTALLRLHHADDAVTAPDAAVSAVKVATRLSRPTAPAVRLGATITSRAIVLPATAVGSPVRLQQLTPRGWVNVANGAMRTSHVYSVAWHPRAAGSYVLRVAKSADALHPTGVSQPWRQVVRQETAADLARAILADRSITLDAVHTSGVHDSATPLADLRSLAAGLAAHRSSYGTAPGGATRVDLRLLRALQRMGLVGSVEVSEIAGGTHAGRSAHYAGEAIDIRAVNGRPVRRGSGYQSVIAICRAFGATQVFSPSYDPYGGHGTHVHCGWGSGGD